MSTKPLASCFDNDKEISFLNVIAQIVGLAIDANNSITKRYFDFLDAQANATGHAIVNDSLTDDRHKTAIEENRLIMDEASRVNARQTEANSELALIAISSLLVAKLVISLRNS